MSLLSSPASRFNLVDYANDLLSQPVEYITRPSGHPTEFPEDADQFLAAAEAERACSLADDSLRADLEAARQHVKSICPGATHVAISQTRKLAVYQHGVEFKTEFLVYVHPHDEHPGIAAFGETLETALAEVAAKLISL